MSSAEQGRAEQPGALRAAPGGLPGLQLPGGGDLRPLRAGRLRDRGSGRAVDPLGLEQHLESVPGQVQSAKLSFTEQPGASVSIPATSAAADAPGARVTASG